MSTQSTLYLFIGTPGAGKTTVATIISKRTGAIHLWADHERQAMFASVTHSKQESDVLYDALNNRTAELLAAGKSVVFDTNFNYQRDRQKLRAIATANDAAVVIIWLQTPLVIARDRALHSNHRDRNNYDSVMTEQQFDSLTCRLEPPSDDEQYIVIDGSDVNPDDIHKVLGI